MPKAEAHQVQGGIFAPRRIGHVNFWVNGVAEVAAFYRDVVGFDEAYRRESIRAIFMTNGNTYHDVAFMDLSSPRGAGHVPGLHHFSLELENEKALVDGISASKDAGFSFDYTISADVTNSAYGTDPDGNRFEVYADVVADWRAARSGAVTTGGRPWTPGATEPITASYYPVDPPITRLTASAFQPKRVSHAVLVTRNHAAMIDHYTRLAGLTVLAGDPDGSFVILGGSLGEETLALFREREGRAVGLHHFGVELRNDQDLERGKAALAARGLQPLFEIDHPTRRCLYLCDPAGQKIQFYVSRSSDCESWSALPEEAALLIA
jgi:catechol 2,3-dioxygenase